MQDVSHLYLKMVPHFAEHKHLLASYYAGLPQTKNMQFYRAPFHVGKKNVNKNVVMKVFISRLGKKVCKI